MRAVLEVGGSHVTAAIVDCASNKVLEARRLGLDSSGSAEMIVQTLVDGVEALGSRARGLPLVVAIPGPFDYDLGVGDFAGVAKFGSLRGLNLGETLGARLNSSVCFVNDVTAFGIGQYELTGRPERMIALTLGTGVGSCFLESGKPVEDGPGVPPNGWVYLLQHEGLPIEETFSTRAIVSAYQRESGHRLEVRDVAGMARDGDPVAAGVLQHSFAALAATLSPWVSAFRAEVVAIGGSIANSWDLIEKWLVPGIREVPASGAAVRVVKAADSEASALVGAARFGESCC